jgi:glyoxalase family protein
VTVNFDDPTTYHFHLWRRVGSPGTILTFFPWPGVPHGAIGTGQVAAIAFEVSGDSAEFWVNRLHDFGLGVGAAHERFGEWVMPFHDPDGLPLELVAVSNPAARRPSGSSSVPSEHALRGFYSATLAEREANPMLPPWLEPERAELLRRLPGLERPVGQVMK